MKIITFLIFLCVLPLAFADLRFGFYSFTCPNAEAIVRQVVERNFNQNISIAAGLLRMHFHDCFVRGCDASILIDPVPTRNKTSEKIAGPNLTVRGFEIIDEAKEVLEQACPSTVSCADILTLATRDGVALSGGPCYDVPTGRRDGLVSNPAEVNIPGPRFSVSQALQSFASKGLTLPEMVTLLGAHTIGFAHCGLFRDRLTNDPTMDPILRARLVTICGLFSRNDPSVFLEESTPFVFDNEFYMQVIERKGILFIDQQLALDPLSSGIVTIFAENEASFRQSFVDAMIKMGSIEVLVGNEGEIRKNCRAFNYPL